MSPLRPPPDTLNFRIKISDPRSMEMLGIDKNKEIAGASLEIHTLDVPVIHRDNNEGRPEYGIAVILGVYGNDDLPYMGFGNQQLSCILMVGFTENDGGKTIKEMSDWFSVATLLRETTCQMFTLDGKKNTDEVTVESLESCDLGVQVVCLKCSSEDD